MQKLFKKDLRKIKSLRKRLTLREIAEIYDVHSTTISKFLRKYED